MKFYCVLFSLILSDYTCFSQSGDSPSPDSLYRQSDSAFRSIYFNAVAGSAQLYHGGKYDVEQKHADGSPFYLSDIMRTGSVTYQGTWYGPLKLYYDLTTDELVLSNYLHDDIVTLSSDKIDSFSVGSHVFVNFRNKENGLPKKGFYEVLYAGDPGVYVRREKKFYFGTGYQVNRYAEFNSYFIRNNGVFYKVEGKSDMLEVFNDQRDAMKSYIHSSKPDFKSKPELAYRLCTEHYSHLKHP